MISPDFDSVGRRKDITFAYPNIFTDIDFYTAAYISRVFPVAVSDEKGVLYDLVLILSKSLRNGQVAIPVSMIEKHTLSEVLRDMFGIDDEKSHLQGPNLDLGFLRSVSEQEGDHPLKLDGDWLYFRRYWLAEQDVLRCITDRKVESPVSQDADEMESLFDFVSDILSDNEGRTDRQIEAVKKALKYRFSIITGGPGTGKTRTVITLASAILKQNPQTRVALVAPTGKAAQRMVESIEQSKKLIRVPIEILARIPDHGKTIHRLLGWHPGLGRYKYHAENRLEYDLIILDEASMVDLPMIARLTRAIRSDCRLILLGDKNQLSSVEAGAVFADLATSGFKEFITELNYSWRFGKDSVIGELSGLVNKGDVSGSMEALQTHGLHHTMSDLTRRLMHQVKIHHTHMLELLINPKNDQLDTAFKLLLDYQILTAHRAGTNGSEYLNLFFDSELVRQLKLDKPNVLHQSDWYAGRPVIIEQNDYDLGLFNGDIGITIEMNGMLYVSFDRDTESGEYRYFSPGQLHNISSAWAITIHKSQGSEYENIAVVLADESSPVITRELLYTAITRARISLSIYSSEKVWKHGVTHRSERKSGLSDKLKNITSDF